MIDTDMNHTKYNSLSKEEKHLRKKIVGKVREMVKAQLPITVEAATSLATEYRGFFLQISFSDVHPLMMICLIKTIKLTAKRYLMVNQLNLNSALGSHAVNDEICCYSYRATQWLDVEMSPDRFYEILDRCVDEATRGYRLMTKELTNI